MDAEARRERRRRRILASTENRMKRILDDDKDVDLTEHANQGLDNDDSAEPDNMEVGPTSFEPQIHLSPQPTSPLLNTTPNQSDSNPPSAPLSWWIKLSIFIWMGLGFLVCLAEELLDIQNYPLVIPFFALWSVLRMIQVRDEQPPSSIISIVLQLAGLEQNKARQVLRAWLILTDILEDLSAFFFAYLMSSAILRLWLD